jgi:xanthine/CO dehydrogenase XdhC/CoxF family maturation factor
MVEVLVEPISEFPAALSDAMRCFGERVPFAICTDIVSGLRWVVTAGHATSGAPAAVASAARALFGVASGIHHVDGRDVFIDVFTPSPVLLVIGAGDDAQPLVRIACDVGFHVVVADRRPGLLTRDRFPDAQLRETNATALALPDGDVYAVVMTHNFADDRDFVRALLATGVRYVGLLGPRQRKERILADIGMASHASASRVYGPVGLDIGTDGAEQVALAVIGEILAVRSGRRPMSLRERHMPIHADVRA